MADAGSPYPGDALVARPLIWSRASPEPEGKPPCEREPRWTSPPPHPCRPTSASGSAGASGGPVVNDETPDSGARATARASGSRWRRITAGILLALAVLAIILGPIMLYVRSQFLDSGAFRNRAETALASPAV